MIRNQIAGAFVIAGLLSGCGSGGAKTSYSVIMTDFSYTPNQIRVQAGEQIALEISNTGAVVHNFIIMKAGSDLGADFDAGDEPNVYWKVEVLPGGSLQTAFTAPAQTGEYLIVCSTAGHYLAGMIGKLIVVGE
jgi:uncharacterized cupredoxin-like copper-binding protein